MNSEDWQQLKELFNAALDREGGDRERFVDDACRQHPALAERLREMVAAHAQASTFLEQPAVVDSALLSSSADRDEDADAPGDALAAGTLLDDTYEVEAMLGRGGMGAVYRVRHRGLGRHFAAKLIHAPAAGDPRFLDRFSREAAALGRLKHPHIVDVTDYGVDHGGGAARPYLVMEYLEGETLEERLRSGPLVMDDALALFDALASAVDDAHARGVLHLDLKPGNVLVGRTGDIAATAKILDFGLAQFVSPDGAGEHDPQPASGRQPIGTPAYMAPEILAGEAPSPAADIYALGVMMYEALAGRRPFIGSTTEVLDQVRHAEAPVPVITDRMPGELAYALTAGLSKRPAQRPPSAADAVARIRAAWLAARRRAWWRVETPVRVGVAAAVALAVALSAPLWNLPWLRRWEQASIDLRFAIAPRHAPAPTVTLLMLDDASLAADATPLVQRADAFGRDLQRIADAGARAIAVDFLLPESWGRSTAFSQFTLRNADRLTLAAFSTPAGEVIGPECLSGVATVAMGPERAASLFGFVNVDQDEDGVSRQGRVLFRDRSNTPRPSFAGHVAASAIGSPAGQPLTTIEADLLAGESRFYIDHSIDVSGFARLSWKDLDESLRTQPALFRDRVVLVGGDFAGAGDEVRTPHGNVIPGVVLHAAALQTIVAGFPVRSFDGRSAALMAGVLSGLLSAVVIFSRNRGVSAGLLLLAGVAYVFCGVAIFLSTQVLLPLAGPVLACLVGGLVALAVHRQRTAYPER